MYKYKIHLFCKFTCTPLHRPPVFCRASCCGARRGPAHTLRRKFPPRPSSMARALGVPAALIIRRSASFINSFGTHRFTGLNSDTFGLLQVLGSGYSDPQSDKCSLLQVLGPRYSDVIRAKCGLLQVLATMYSNLKSGKYGLLRVLGPRYSGLKRGKYDVVNFLGQGRATI